MPARWTVDLVTINGTDVPGVLLTVAMLRPEPVFPLGDPSVTLIPTEVVRTTNAQGIAQFQLLPSALLNNHQYVCTGPGFRRTFTMPDRDVRLSQL